MPRYVDDPRYYANRADEQAEEQRKRDTGHSAAGSNEAAQDTPEVRCGHAARRTVASIRSSRPD